MQNNHRKNRRQFVLNECGLKKQYKQDENIIRHRDLRDGVLRAVVFCCFYIDNICTDISVLPKNICTDITSALIFFDYLYCDCGK